MMAERKHISTKARRDLFLAHSGVCHICGGKIMPGLDAWEVEHVIPLALGGDDGPSNWRPAHAKCHKAKTRQDASDIGRARRVHAKHIGASAPSRTPMPYGRHDRRKKKIDGTVVDRMTGEPIGGRG